MSTTLAARYAVMSAAITVAGCAATTPPSRPVVPAALEAPAGEIIFLVAGAEGVQVYECNARAVQPVTYGWTLHSAEAALTDTSGRAVGKHYYPGPTWEATDGSSFVSDVKARDPGSDKSAVPWLLLGVKSVAGTGTFSGTTSLQRIRTVGGIAPAATCGASNIKQLDRVPYSAVFYFYRKAT